MFQQELKAASQSVGKIDRSQLPSGIQVTLSTGDQIRFNLLQAMELLSPFSRLRDYEQAVKELMDIMVFYYLSRLESDATLCNSTMLNQEVSSVLRFQRDQKDAIEELISHVMRFVESHRIKKG